VYGMFKLKKKYNVCNKSIFEKFIIHVW
jgi:hypothetical protein